MCVTQTLSSIRRPAVAAPVSLVVRQSVNDEELVSNDNYHDGDDDD